MGAKIADIETLKLLIGAKDSQASDLLDSVEKTKSKIIDSAKASEPLKRSLSDSYGNKITSIGKDDKIESFSTYGFDNDSMNWPLWLALYNDSWVFRRAIDKPAQDMVRSGINVSMDSEKMTEVIDEVKAQRKNLIELIQWGRLFGGSIAVMMFDSMKDEDYGKQIDISKLRKARIMTMYVTDR